MELKQDPDQPDNAALREAAAKIITEVCYRATHDEWWNTYQEADKIIQLFHEYAAKKGATAMNDKNPALLQPGARVITIELVVNDDRSMNQMVGVIAKELNLQIGCSPNVDREFVTAMSNVPVPLSEMRRR